MYPFRRNNMASVEIKKDIYWVGAIDWDIRDFHGYEIPHGTTYNSYLVVDDKTVLFDTVKKGFMDELVDNIKNVINPEKIDYLVIDHVELDHSGCLPDIVALVKPEKVFCSPMGEKAIRGHFHNLDLPLEIVKTGDEISIGKRTIKFLESRMLHWPDSMCSYLQEDKVLISNDIFGQHWAMNERFDDEVSFDNLMFESAKYYANIILPYSPVAIKFLDFVTELNIKPEILATDHGVIWRTHIDKILAAYRKWALQKAKRKAVIVYGTMWGSTDMMAKSIERGLVEEKIEVKSLNLSSTHRSEVITEILDAKAVIFGSPTLNNGILPSVADSLTYIKGLRPKDKIGAAFGSYGWGGEAVKILNQWMLDMNFDIVDDGVRIKYIPNQDDLKACVQLGKLVAGKVKERCRRI